MSRLEKKLTKAGFEIMETESQKTGDVIDLKDDHKAIISENGGKFTVSFQDKSGKEFATMDIKKDGSVEKIGTTPADKQKYVKEFLTQFGALSK